VLSLLAKYFIRSPQNASASWIRAAYGMLAGALGIALNALLCLVKLAAGLLSGSIAVTADAFNNLSDAASSLITLIGFKLSSKRPASDHPFGHGRMEYLTGLAVSFLILLMGFELFKSSVEKIAAPQSVALSSLTVLVLLCSIAIKGYMFAYNRALGKRFSSPAMEAAAADSRSDMLATALILASMLISRFTPLLIDGWAGLLVSTGIFWTGICTARDTINPLLGQSPDPELVAQIRQTVLETPDVLGVHDLIVHDYGLGRRMASLHAEVPASGDLLTLHNHLDRAERRIKTELGCDAVIHMDPVVTDDERIAPIRQQIEALIHTHIDASIRLHDFRMIVGRRHVNLIFDAAAPFDFPQPDEALKQAVIDLLHKEIDATLHILVQIDRE